MKKLLLLGILLASSGAYASWCDDNEPLEVNLFGVSRHPHKSHPFHEVNWGLGGRYYLSGCNRLLNIRPFGEFDWVHPNSVGGTFKALSLGAQWRPDFARIGPLEVGVEAMAGPGSYSIPFRHVTIRRPIFIPGVVVGAGPVTFHVEYLGKPKDFFRGKEAKAYFGFVSYAF